MNIINKYNPNSQYFSQLRVIFTVIALFLVKINISVLSQDKYINILTTEDGLNSNNILSITQDKQGLIWIGTQQGVSTYDGKEFVNYESVADTVDYAEMPAIREIHVDNDNNVLACSYSRTVFFSRDQNMFFRPLAYAPKSIRNISIRSIYAEKNDTMWIGGERSFGLYNIKTKEFKPATDNFIYTVNQLFKSSDNKIWIGTFKKGIYCFDPLRWKFIPYPKLETVFKGNKINVIAEDELGRLWIGGTKNLFVYDIKKDELIDLKPLIFKKNSNDVNDIAIDNEGRIIVGLGGTGIFYMDIHFNILDIIASDFNNPLGLPSNSIKELFIDSDNRLWIAGYGSGLCIIDPHKVKYKLIRRQENETNSILNDIGRAAIEDQNGNIWFGTQSGLSIYNKTEKTWKHLYTDLEDNVPFISLCLDRDKVWAGTYGKGAYLFDPVTLESKNFSYNAFDTNSIGTDRIYSIVKDKYGNIWFGGLWGDLSVYSPKSNSFKRYNIKDPFEVNAINDRLYVGTVQGMQSIDLISGEIKTHVTRRHVRKIFEDSKGRIWLVIKNGLLLFDPDQNNYKLYSEEEGLSSNTILGVVEDNKGNLWMSTTLGISSFSPETNTFTNYNKHDGLPFEEFNRNAYAKTTAGEIIFGGNKGFLIFNPDDFVKPHFLLYVILKELKIWNKPANFGLKDSPLEKELDRTEKIVLQHTQNSFSIKFSAINYTNPSNNYYTWKLDGFEKDWTPPGKQRTAVYTNIEPGEYTLRIKAFIGKYGQSFNERTVDILIVPPFWKKLWFKILIFLTILFCAFLFYYLRISSLKTQKNILEEKVRERTAEIKEKNQILLKQSDKLSDTNIKLKERQQQIEEQAEELKNQTEYLNDVNLKLEKQSSILKKQTTELADANQQLKELNSSKDKLFSIIAHDLKNPFSSIMGYSELLIRGFKDYNEDKKLTYINRIADSTKVVYNLLENLLFWARTQINLITLKPINLSINNSIKNSLKILKENYEKKNQIITFNDRRSFQVLADSNMINTVIQNILTNAIKFTPKDGEIIIDCQEVKNMVQISVKDTGIGMDEEIINNLFKIDQSSTREGTSGEGGTGLGLLLCKEFIKKNGGEIWAKSKPGKGSVFYFTLPLNKR